MTLAPRDLIWQIFQHTQKLLQVRKPLLHPMFEVNCPWQRAQLILDIPMKPIFEPFLDILVCNFLQYVLPVIRSDHIWHDRLSDGSGYVSCGLGRHNCLLCSFCCINVWHWLHTCSYCAIFRLSGFIIIISIKCAYTRIHSLQPVQPYSVYLWICLFFIRTLSHWFRWGYRTCLWKILRVIVHISCAKVLHCLMRSEVRFTWRDRRSWCDRRSLPQRFSFNLSG